MISERFAKADLVALYKHVLNFHDHYPLLQDVLAIMEEKRLKFVRSGTTPARKQLPVIITPETVAVSLRFLTLYPQASMAYDVRNLFEIRRPRAAGFCGSCYGFVDPKTSTTVIAP